MEEVIRRDHLRVRRLEVHASGRFLLCPQVESRQYGMDDTALNGIRLVCAKDGDRSFVYSVESHTG